MAYIYPILGWMNFRAAGTPLLPSFYTEYYSQEDRLKSMAIILQRIATWGDANAEKINEMVEVLNNTGAVDVSELIERMNDIEAEFGSVETAVQNQLDTFLTEIQELSTAVDEASGLIQDFEADVNAILAKNTEQDGKISALETFRGAIQATVNSHGTRITALETAQAGVNTSISNLSGKVTALETLTNGFDNRIASAESAVSSIQADVNAIKAVKTVGNVTSSVNVTGSGATINVNYNEKNIDGTGSTDKSASVPLTSSDSSVTFASYTAGGSQGIDIKAVGGGGGTDPDLTVRVTSLENEVTELSDSVDSNSGSVSSLETRVTELESGSGGGGTSALELRVDTLEDNLDGYITSNDSEINTIKSRLTSNDRMINDLSYEISENYSLSVDNRDRIMALEDGSGGGGGTPTGLRFESDDNGGTGYSETWDFRNIVDYYGVEPDKTTGTFRKTFSTSEDLSITGYFMNDGETDVTVDATLSLSDMFLARIDTLETQLADALARIEALETP